MSATGGDNRAQTAGDKQPRYSVKQVVLCTELCGISARAHCSDVPQEIKGWGMRWGEFMPCHQWMLMLEVIHFLKTFSFIVLLFGFIESKNNK